MIKKIKSILLPFGLIFLYLLFQEIATLIASQYKDNRLYQNTILIISNIVITIIFIIIFRKDLITDLKDFKKNYSKYIPESLKCWILGFIIMFTLNVIITTVLGGIAPNEEGNRMLIKMFPIYMTISVCFTSPICEELLFRLNFKNFFKSKTAKILFAGILFGAAHLMVSENLLELLFIFPYSALGICLSAAYFKTGNIFSSIFAHMVHNTTILLLLFTFI